MHTFNFFPGDLNTYGKCVDPFVLHIAGHRSKNSLNRSGLVGLVEQSGRQLER